MNVGFKDNNSWTKHKIHEIENSIKQLHEKVFPPESNDEDDDTTHFDRK